MAKINFNKVDSDVIKAAVQEAESKTSGEIAVALIKESDNYAIYELLFALFCGFVYFFIMMFFVTEIENILKSLFWGYSASYLLLFYGLSIFVVISAVYFLSNISFIDRLVIPKSVMRRKVNERAVRQFMESGVYNTKDRTGILIFISQLEHCVELLADKGINEKISQEKWDLILNHIVEGIKSGDIVNNLSESISDCGKLLADNFPIQSDDINELKDGIEILEK